MRVRLSKVWGASFLAIGALDASLYRESGSTLQLVLVFAMAFAGITHLFGSLLVLDGNTVIIKNPIGMTMRTLVADAMEVRGRALLVTTGGVTRKVNGLFANGDDWRALAAKIAERT